MLREIAHAIAMATQAVDGKEVLCVKLILFARAFALIPLRVGRFACFTDVRVVFHNWALILF